ncbi:MAG: di-trans,poly-cis-decaprenylcistransferase [Chloroflexi bacterium]|nr:di-trans,poly-cis-decaprenylcistransferase [Chloroflexota bacterium]
MTAAIPPEGCVSQEPLALVPRHVAIIMDGNGRWARARGLPRAAGHRAGVENLRRILRAAVEFGIEYLTLYAFSTENWSRPPTEVRALMGLLERALRTELQELHESGVRIRHIGATDGLAAGLVKGIRDAEALTAGNTRLNLNVCLNYGGRREIVEAVRRIVAAGVAPEQIDEQAITRHLWMADSPDPDLIIRTAGEMRLSNFLLWEAAYAEFYSTPTLWPDFDRAELLRALEAFQRRQRRYGGLTSPTTDEGN